MLVCPMVASRAVKASLVGANTVNLPVPLRVVTKSGNFVRAATSELRSG